ncbi:hypothetical protein [Natronobiforma cellulositropha]|uniref:hypothetical protein n=1 Tax=Natronobiforma cellulositropha TaxID=1679076 RepID=UPI0021D59656|nr:hypothetical protein [Natronobiforma cellulositropha]
MATQRRLRYVSGQLAWMVGTVLVLSALGSYSHELFFVLSLVGLLIVTELTAPFNVRPAWRARLPWLIALGLLGFAYVVTRRIVALLPPEVVPW